MRRLRATAYWNGWGVPRDEAQAEEWWARATGAGDAEAAWLVAVRHSNRRDFAGGLPTCGSAAARGAAGASGGGASGSGAGSGEAEGSAGSSASGSEAQGSGSASLPALTVEQGPDYAAGRAARQDAADHARRLADAQAKAAADAAAATAAMEARANASRIACHGSLEAWRKARASCQ